MVDRDVPGQPRALERPRDVRPDRTERGAQERGGLLERGELPEAVHDADPEAAGQERTGAVTPGAVLGAIAKEVRHVVAAVVVDDEEAATRPEHPIDLHLLLQD